MARLGVGKYFFHVFCDIIWILFWRGILDWIGMFCCWLCSSIELLLITTPFVGCFVGCFVGSVWIRVRYFVIYLRISSSIGSSSILYYSATVDVVLKHPVMAFICHALNWRDTFHLRRCFFKVFVLVLFTFIYVYFIIFYFIMSI